MFFAFSYYNFILNVELVMEDEENVLGLGTRVGYETEEDAIKMSRRSDLEDDNVARGAYQLLLLSLK